jgi:hypothetical protein
MVCGSEQRNVVSTSQLIHFFRSRQDYAPDAYDLNMSIPIFVFHACSNAFGWIWQEHSVLMLPGLAVYFVLNESVLLARLDVSSIPLICHWSMTDLTTMVGPS